MKKRVLVTGISRGIGAAVGRALSGLGYRVVGTSRYPGKMEDKIEGVEYIPLDLNDVASIMACIQKVQDVDVLINNAGQSQIGPAEEFPLDKTEALFQTNLFGLIRLIQGFLPGMRERRNGTIINVGSMTGKFAVPFQSGYVATKFALAGYTWSLRNEVRPFGIRVVTVEPNDIRTTIEPQWHMNEGSEYADSLRMVKQVRDANMVKAHGPEMVARKIVRILRLKKPAPFYVVGGIGPFFAFLKRFLPDRTVENLVRKNYGLK